MFYLVMALKYDKYVRNDFSKFTSTQTYIELYNYLQEAQ